MRIGAAAADYSVHIMSYYFEILTHSYSAPIISAIPNERLAWWDWGLAPRARP
jgi:hypothetical protein